MRKSAYPFAEIVINEARNIARYLVEIERGKVGGDVDLALYRVASTCGIEEGSLRSLRYRPQTLSDIKGSVLERLREAFEESYERERCKAMVEREINARLAREGYIREEVTA